jgi:hypothetical protein
MEGHVVPLPVQGKPSEICVVVGVIQEGGLALVSTRDDVVEEAGREEPGPAGHVL